MNPHAHVERAQLRCGFFETRHIQIDDADIGPGMRELDRGRTAETRCYAGHQLGLAFHLNPDRHRVFYDAARHAPPLEMQTSGDTLGPLPFTPLHHPRPAPTHSCPTTPTIPVPPLH